jgi:hypothetical protein
MRFSPVSEIAFVSDSSAPCRVTAGRTMPEKTVYGKKKP